MRTLLLVIAFTAVAAVGHAQPELTEIEKHGLNAFEISASIYGTKGFHENLGQRNLNTDTEDFTEMICGSLASGFGASLSARSHLCGNAQIGLGLDYFRGCNTLTNENLYGMGGSTYSSIDYAQYNRVSLVPHIRLESNRENPISYFGQLGVIIPVIRNTIFTSEQTTFLGTQTTRGIGRDNFSLGLNYGGGVQFNFEKFSLEAGLFGNQLVGKSRQFEYTSYINYQGIEDVGSLNPYQRETRYVDRLDGISNNFQYNQGASNDLPKEELFRKRGNHNLGPAFGFNYRF